MIEVSPPLPVFKSVGDTSKYRRVFIEAVTVIFTLEANSYRLKQPQGPNKSKTDEVKSTALVLPFP